MKMRKTLIITASLIFSIALVAISCSEGLLGGIDKLREEAAEENKPQEGSRTDAQTPEITLQPVGRGCAPGETITLSISANVDDGGVLTYQWYKSDENNYNNGEKIDDAITHSYAPSTSAIGVTYYWVVVTNTNDSVDGNKVVTKRSDIIAVTVSQDAQTPNITLQPQSGTYTQSTVVTLSVTASVTDGGILSYQWYNNGTINSNTGGVTIGGATDRTYTPDTSATGTTHYYVVVTNTNNAVNGEKTARVTSEVATITVNTLVNAQTPVVKTLVAASYKQNDTATALDGTATITDGGTPSYQWYWNSTSSTTGGTAISPGGTNPTYTPPTNTVLTRYYYVVVTNTNDAVNGNKVVTATSNSVQIVVAAIVNAQQPTITTQPLGAIYDYNDVAANLTVAANVTDGGTLSYQWYRNDTISATGGEQVGTGSIYSRPITSNLGTLYYYVVVTNTNTNVNGATTATRTSNVVAVTVRKNLTMTVGAPLRALSPIYTTSPVYDERFTTFTVTVGGILDSAAATNVGLSITAITGLTFSGHLVTNGTYNSGTGVKTFTVTVTYNGTAELDSLENITVTGLSAVPNNYLYTEGSKTTTLTIYSGYGCFYDDEIPVNSTNISAFNAFARTSDGRGRRYKLTQNVTLTSNWVPIGTTALPFYGAFDGGGYTISNLTINTSGSDNVGFFGYVAEIYVYDLKLQNVSITGKNNVGAIVGNLINEGYIYNCHVISGTVTGSQNVGGIVGLGNYAEMGELSVAGNVIGTGNDIKYIGGIVGWLDIGDIGKSYVTGNVTATNNNVINNVGGIAGFVDAVGISRCFTKGNVTAEGHVNSTWYTGGIVGGHGEDGLIENCFSTGTIKGTVNVGGIVGIAFGSVEKCYATGSVISSGSSDNYGVGGITGSIDGPGVKNCIALNSSISIQYAQNEGIGRVSGDELNLINNYGISSTTIRYNNSGTTYNPVSSLNGKDGLTTSSHTISNFYTTAGNWSGGAWNLTTIWEWNAGLVRPILRGFDGVTQ